jgi:tetratricopeptide (TPR) repeat protein
VALAKKLIGDARSRELYELRRDTKGALLITASGLKEGPTPSARSGAAGGARGGSSGGGKSALDRGRALMTDGEFRPALALLEEAREEEPSSPEVLAALGWTTWKVHGARSVSDAEEYLLLALAFDERSAAAVASLARIYLAQSNEQKARLFLKRLLRLESDATWAKRALSELGPPPSGDDGAAR